VRVDTGVVQGDEVSIFYDPMIAKLIVHGEDRSTALDALIRALHDYQIVGLPTNIEFVARTAAHPEFRRGGVDTSFLNKYGDEVLAPLGSSPKPVRVLAAVSLLALEQQRLASSLPPVPASLASFRTLSTTERVITLKHEQVETAVCVANLSHDTFEVSLSEDGESSAAETFTATGAVDSNGNFEYRVDARKFKGTAVVHGRNLHIFCNDGSERYDYVFEVPAPSIAGSESASSDAGAINKKVVTPMPGKIIKVLVKVGDEVTSDQPLLIMEAMKMEHVLRASRDGKVGEVWCAEGDFVGDNQVLIELD
jgi:3-methylcrotonyl-CoA carboxylase alpha subunit